MILTGSEIVGERERGHIVIEPFLAGHVNPNSYNYRLGPCLGVPRVEAGALSFEFVDIPPAGYVIRPRRMYLGHTFERLGSNKYAMSLIGRSSLGRLGLFLQVSANLGHTGTCHHWTLEIVAAKAFRLYPFMRVGQISFWENSGDVNAYAGGYANYDAPTPSRHAGLGRRLFEVTP